MFTGFINQNSEQNLPLACHLYGGLPEFLVHHGQVRILWIFDLDKRDLSNAQKADNYRMFRCVCKVMRDVFRVSPSSPGVEFKYINKRILTHFDLFDRTRVIFKLGNPLYPSRFFFCITVLNLELVRQLADFFNDL
ncbi:MAG: hypothetical protein RBG13Loki_3389 [Promethearchaeota archaeon CR_4]|nr:MAG: hypothetical protein RBG13Loki_3389 [Candidatus Lokiarchaeota archaeon CR_4]